MAGPAESLTAVPEEGYRGVVHDLILALIAAVVVGLAPGWFWSRVLVTRADLAERLTYAVALSMTLVPTVALLQSRLFGTGVTLLVTLISVSLVFAAGLFAYLRFGPAKEPDEEIAERPAAMDLPTLAPLAAALALALAALLGLVSEGLVALSIPLLVFAAGVSVLPSFRRDGETEEPAREEKPEGSEERKGLRVASNVALVVVLILVLARGYLGPVLNDWPYLRGDDQYQHSIMTRMTMDQGSTETFMLYPPGIHFLVAGISRLSGLDPLEIFPVLAPLLPVLPALALYALGRRLWDREVGVAAAAFGGLLIGGTYWYFAHGRYPNLISAQFLLVLAVAALVRLYASPSSRSGLLLALTGSSVVLYHMVGSLYEAVLLAFVAAMFLPRLLLNERPKGLAMLLSFTLLGVLSVLYAWDTYDLPDMVGGLFGGSETGEGGEAVKMALGTKPAEGLDHLVEMTSHPVLWLGLLGSLVLLAGGRGRGRLAGGMACATLLLWTVMLFVGSRTPMSAFPDRFERDLGVPLALLAALAFVTLIRSIRFREPLTLFAATLAVLLAGSLVVGQAAKNLAVDSGPHSQLSMTPEVEEAGEWLREHNEGGNIVSTPYIGAVPSRGMLALGRYTGVQSFRAERIERARDLPPSGAEPLRDALRVLTHPAGERTRSIIREKDIRYVVLSKTYGVIPPKPFLERDDLYRVRFENEQVVILEPRESWVGERRP
jgi:hypothetical protein